RYTVVVEAWGPPCESDRIAIDVDNLPFCQQTVLGPSTVLRGHYCQSIELSADRGIDTAADLRSFADIGSIFQTPTTRDLGSPVNRFDEDLPQPLVEGVDAQFPFFVQLLDEVGNDQNRVLVHWSIDEGLGDFSTPVIATAGFSPSLGSEGVASVTVRARLGAHAINDGRLIVTAYAPGYENAPFAFHAQAVPAVGVRTRRVDISKSRADLESAHIDFSRVIQGDLDNDNRPDILTVVGQNTHRLVALYDRGDGEFELKTSVEMPGLARSIEIVRAGASPPAVVVSRAERFSSIETEIDGQRVWLIDRPRFEIWRSFRTPNAVDDVVLPDGPQILSAFNGTAIFQVANAMDAGDIDEDGYDELVAARCSYNFNPVTNGSGQFNRCYGGSIDDEIDSELVILSPRINAQGDIIDFEERGIVPAFGLPGGFRTAQFTDLNGDGDLDIISNNFLQVLGACGDRGLPSEGYGFPSPANQFFSATGFSDNFGLAAGRFNGDVFSDIVSTGALRPNSPDAGFSVLPGTQCGLPTSLPAVVSGGRIAPELLAVKTADINGDGWDDILFLDRSGPRLRLFFGAGSDLLAVGPSIELPGGPSAEFDVAAINATTHRAAIPVRRQNAVYMIEFWPDIP
ncbi:MAG: hypothetical protein AAF449_20560, partial [Myxococcota bacterium]